MNTHSSGYYSIDKDYNILSYNDTAKQLYPNLQPGVKCYKALMGLDSPCPPCPVALGIQGPKTYLDPIRHIYETVDAVETVHSDGSRGHAVVESEIRQQKLLKEAHHRTDRQCFCRRCPPRTELWYERTSGQTTGCGKNDPYDCPVSVKEYFFCKYCTLTDSVLSF